MKLNRKKEKIKMIERKETSKRMRENVVKNMI